VATPQARASHTVDLGHEQACRPLRQHGESPPETRRSRDNRVAAPTYQFRNPAGHGRRGGQQPGGRQLRQQLVDAPPYAANKHKEQRTMKTWEDYAPYVFAPDGCDSTRDLSDEELARAIADTGNLLSTAVALSERHGRIVARTATRVEASPELQHILDAARESCMERAVANALRRVGEDRDLKALERKRREGLTRASWPRRGL
jgi:hypothetical protein